MNVCELTLVVLTSPRSRTGTTGWGTWRMLWWDHERSRPLSPSQLWLPDHCLRMIYYLIILYRTPLYIKVVTFIYVPWVIICVRLDPTTLTDYFAPRFWPPKIWVWHFSLLNFLVNTSWTGPRGSSTGLWVICPVWPVGCQSNWQSVCQPTTTRSTYVRNCWPVWPAVC
jgi:hypothetical protein